MNDPIRKIIAFDTETFLIRAGSNAPELVCLSWADDRGAAGLLHHAEGAAWFRAQLSNPSTLLVGHNLAFDTAVMSAYDSTLIPEIFRAYEEDRLTCTMLREQLLDIGDGQFRGFQRADGTRCVLNYSLADLYRRYEKAELKKDTWRMLYGNFRDVPLKGWVQHARTIRPDLDPQGVLEYPVEDATATRDVYFAQVRRQAEIPDQFRQARAYFASRLAECWGVRTSLLAVDELERVTGEKFLELQSELLERGLVKQDKKGKCTRDTKAARARMAEVWPVGKPLPRTPSGDVALDSDACENSEDLLLEQYSMYSTYSKVQSTDVKLLRQGTLMPIHARYGLAASGRTTCSKPNLQNLRSL